MPIALVRVILVDFYVLKKRFYNLKICAKMGVEN